MTLFGNDEMNAIRMQCSELPDCQDMLKTISDAYYAINKYLNLAMNHRIEGYCHLYKQTKINYR